MYTLFVDYNGDCLICPDDWKKKLVVGNLKKEKIINVWEKKIFHEVRKSLLKGDRSHSPCNECDVDGLLSGNEFAKKWGEFYEKVNTKIKPLFIGFGKQAWNMPE